jgi:5-methylcytosine-specific restriction endonuclease McrA
VDHIDGNHSNNDPANLQTLCKNCHSLKTYAPHLFGATIDRPPD